MTFWQFIQAHYLVLAALSWFVFTCAVNALGPQGQTFSFSVWFPAFLRELVQQAPTKYPVLSTAQKKALADAGVPVQE